MPGDPGAPIIYCDSLPAPAPQPVAARAANHLSPCHHRDGNFTAGSFNHVEFAARALSPSLLCDGLENSTKISFLAEKDSGFDGDGAAQPQRWQRRVGILGVPWGQPAAGCAVPVEASGLCCSPSFSSLWFKLWIEFLFFPGHPSLPGRNVGGWSQIEPMSLYKVCFITCPGFILYVGLSHISASPTLVWLAQENITNYRREGCLYSLMILVWPHP